MILHSIKEGIPQCERSSGGPSWPSRFAFVLAMLLLMVLVVPVGLALVVVLPVAVAWAAVEVWAEEVAYRREARAQILAGIREP